MERKYYYHTSDGELHGPAELDFLVREVKWGGLPDSLMVRSENSGEWISLAEVVQGNTSAGWPLDVMSVTPEELARMSRWKRCGIIIVGPGKWHSCLKAGLRSRNACLFSCP